MPKTILCIDDDPFYKDLFKAILEPKGYRVLTALNPADGWEIILKDRPDIITLDVMMPESGGFFDGYGLLKKLKDDESLKSIPVMMVSALGDPEDIRHGLDSGASGYLPKQDMTPDRLLLEIARVVGQ